jgi:putative flippase GtrA
MMRRIADRGGVFARLGHPVAAQLVRYAFAGAATAAIGTTTVLLLSGVAGLGIQLAILCSYPLILIVHFALQRFFVFVDRETYTLAVTVQLRRYLVVSAGHYGCVAAGTALLVRLAGLDDQVAYVITILTMPIVMFVALRLGVFH